MATNERLKSAMEKAKEYDKIVYKTDTSTGRRLAQAKETAKKLDTQTYKTTEPVAETLPTAKERIGSGVKSIGNTLLATPFVIGETIGETAKAMPDYLKDKWSPEVWKRVGEDFRYILGDRDTPRTEVKNVEISDYGKIDEDSFGMKRMDKAMEQRANVTKGMSGPGAFFADTLVGIGQTGATLALSGGHPLVAAGVMGATTGAQKAYEVAKEGGSAVEAYARGASAAGTEIFTEALPLDNLIDIYKKGGKSVLKNVAKQVGVEPTEEVISVVAEYLADKNAGDEDAELTAKDIFLAAAGGLLSAGFMSAVASAAGRLRNNLNSKKTTLPTKETTPVETEKNIKVGQKTILKNPYTGKTPTQQPKKSRATPNVSDELVENAKNRILTAEQRSQNGEGAFKNLLTKAYEAVFQPVRQIPVEGVRFENGQYFVNINKNVPAKVISDVNHSPEKIALLEMLPDVVTNGEFVGSTNGKKKVVRYDHFETPVTIHGKPYLVLFETEVYPDTNNYKTHRLTKMELVQQSGEVTGTPPASPESATAPSGEILTHQKPVVNTDTSVGAAPAGFDPWSNFQNKKNEFFTEGANAARPVDVPTTDLDGRNIRKTASTAMGAKAIPDEVVSDIQNMVMSGKLSYDSVTDKASTERAVYTIKEKGFDGAVEEFRNAVQKGYVSKDLATLGQQLLINAANSGDIEGTAKLLSLYSEMETAAGQAVQAASILRKLSPDSQLYAIKYNLGELKKVISKRYGEEISVPKELEEKFLAQTDQDGRNAVMEEIKDAVAKQIPSNWKDKWNAWRYLAMLGNPRTHARNVFGNAIFQPVRVTKDAIGTVLEKAVSNATGGKIERTKSFIADPAMYKAALADWKNVKDTLTNNGKLNDTFHELESKKEIFSLPILEKARVKNTELLEAEDVGFKKMTYADALAKYLKANGITAEQMVNGEVPNKLMSKARDYAGNEAMRATYQDKNAISELISRMGRYEGDHPAGKVASAIVEGIMPFRRTPANILVRGLEYSPVGAAKGVYDAFRNVKKGKISAAKAIDEIAAGLTGTALTVLGLVLGRLGVVSPSEDENKEQAELDAITGKQNYALNLPDGSSYTLDWAAPSALPFFMGTELAETAIENGITLDVVLEILKSASEPMLEMSMLQTLNDVLDSISYADNQIGEIAKTALVSYLNQAIPTLGGQIERISEDKRMSTYTDRTLPMPRDAQYAIGKASARLPFDYQQIPYIDAWGREEKTGGVGQRMFENLVSPGYISKNNETAADKEIQRLLDANQTGVVPNKPSQSVKVTYKDNPNANDNQKKYLTAEEYVTYSKIKGQTSYNVVSGMIDTPEYKRLTDEEKADAIKKAYEYAGHLASEAVTGNKHESEKYVELAKTAKKELGLSESEYLLLCNEYGATLANGDKIRDAYKEGITPWEYAAYSTGKSKYDADKNKSYNMDEHQKSIEESGLPEEKQLALWKLAYPDWVKKAEEKGMPFDVYVKIKLGKY